MLKIEETMLPVIDKIVEQTAVIIASILNGTVDAEHRLGLLPSFSILRKRWLFYREVAKVYLRWGFSSDDGFSYEIDVSVQKDLLYRIDRDALVQRIKMMFPNDWNRFVSVDIRFFDYQTDKSREFNGCGSEISEANLVP